MENRIAQKIGEEFTTPAIGGHARMLPILGKALGVSADEMIECELIPEARDLVDFFRALVDRYPACRMLRCPHGRRDLRLHLARFQQSLPKYGVSKEDMKYFRVHEKRTSLKNIGGTNQAILEVALQEGYGQRTRWLATGILR